MNMLEWSQLMTWLGFIMCVFGVLLWLGSRSGSTTFLIVLLPGLSLIIMGWVGDIGNRILKRLESKDIKKEG